ncbi:uncharacterized protein ASPGLDRAFT_786638 [Aspergillus glaucus CBS 516.65]|uniref:Uncharacterized protein n=1 Tax=Aspergillus glaucus CBS 516.65 TaxID=1160497 RepID=A0A1L9VBA5_ASPGL|nr:hypothetical protein ASPGLDRAFT_786638 [Aspergillus glaucus CBS 516.65]OJJ81218.1 hypothetical protein ASPGLDRAFT_786638 [Aspergillus glaucus CBS 516.65]
MISHDAGQGAMLGLWYWKGWMFAQIPTLCTLCLSDGYFLVLSEIDNISIVTIARVRSEHSFIHQIKS